MMPSPAYHLQAAAAVYTIVGTAVVLIAVELDELIASQRSMHMEF